MATCTQIRAQLASLLKDREDLSCEVLSDQGDLQELQSEGSHVNPTLLTKAKARLAADEAKLKQIDDQIAALSNAVVRITTIRPIRFTAGMRLRHITTTCR